jgi:hypothetical protein
MSQRKTVAFAPRATQRETMQEAQQKNRIKTRKKEYFS